ncbi:hypothetical protein ACFL59_05310 [Planctomycetota bacterium]
MAAPAIDLENRTVGAVCASDFSVLRDEGASLQVLLVAGVQLPETVPLLECHGEERLSVLGPADDHDWALGTASDFRAEGGRILCKLRFGETDRAKRAFREVVRGRLDAVSIGFSFLERHRIPPGKVERVCGQLFYAPPHSVLNVGTRSGISEVSLVPRGADAEARVRFKPPEEAGSELERLCRLAAAHERSRTLGVLHGARQEQAEVVVAHNGLSRLLYLWELASPATRAEFLERLRVQAEIEHGEDSNS